MVVNKPTAIAILSFILQFAVSTGMTAQWKEKPVLREHTPLTVEQFEGVYIVKPKGISDKELLFLAAEVRPSWRQLRYQERGMTGFVHFGVNTFLDQERGTGEEDPRIFNPVELDTDTWVEAFRNAGISCITMVVKHHDGFCLWPSQYTEHCVKNTPWKLGKGDVVREFVDSCRKYGTAVGFYYSPWDMHEKTYGTEAYNDYMVNQLDELLSNYGPIEVVWFDGAGQAKKVNGKLMPFDWERIYRFIRKKQPRAVIDGGMDARHVGNESGQGKFVQWAVQSVDVTDPFLLNMAISGLDKKSPDLGKLEDLRSGKTLYWWPARGGLPTRVGWFWQSNTDHTVRSLHYLVESYFGTVGQNSHLQINLAPDDRGLTPKEEQTLYAQFGKYLCKLYETNYAEGASTSAQATRLGDYSADRLLDGKPYTCWAAPDGTTTAEILIDLPEKRVFNVVKLQENVRDLGQRISAFAIDIMSEDAWKTVFEGTTVGSRRLVRIPMANTDHVRIRILQARACPSLCSLEFYLTPAILAPPSIKRDKQGKVSISAADNVVLRYTTDGSDPTADSPLYEKPFDLPRGGSVKALALPRRDAERIETGDVLAAEEFGLAPAKWRIVGLTDSMAQRPGSPMDAIDTELLTAWRSGHIASNGKSFHELVVDLGETYDVTGFGYTPEQRDRRELLIPTGQGSVQKYAFYVSEDGATWGEPLCEGTFGNIKNNPVRQVVKTKKSKQGRFVRFVAREAVDDERQVRAAEIEVFVEL